MEEQSYTSIHPWATTGPIMGTLYLFLYVKLEGKSEVQIFLCLSKNHAMKSCEGVHQIGVSGQLQPFHSWLEL